jgi:hypothetical protein
VKFYTNVSRYGNMLLYRGYDHGNSVRKRIKYEPTLFVTTPNKSEWKSLDGKNVAPVPFPSMRDAKEWVQTNKHVNSTAPSRLTGAWVQEGENFVAGCDYQQRTVSLSSHRNAYAGPGKNSMQGEGLKRSLKVAKSGTP